LPRSARTVPRSALMFVGTGLAPRRLMVDPSLP
jgi:hypothetical protein